MSAKTVESKPVVAAPAGPRVVERRERRAVPMAPPMMATEHLLAQVREVARHMSEIRRIESAFSGLYPRMLDHIREIPSTSAEMEADWWSAWAFVCLRLIEGPELSFTQLETSAYPHFESVWLKRVKELKAYYVWKTGGGGDAVGNYFKASATIRRLLLEREPASVHDFERVKSYLEDRYLKPGDNAVLDESKPATHELIERKAHRIWEKTGERDERANWFRARLYTAMFYENIIGAVLDNNEQKTRTILKAFEFSKAPQNRYLVTNAFETAVAICFLDKKTIRRVLEHPEWYDFSMEPLADWPANIAMPPGLRYDSDNRQLILEGLMSEEDAMRLQAALSEDTHRAAVARLCAQSQLRPFEEQIL